MKKGPKFCVTVWGNYFEVKSDKKNLTRSMKLVEQFHDVEYHEESFFQKKTNYHIETSDNLLENIINKKKFPSIFSQKN